MIQKARLAAVSLICEVGLPQTVFDLHLCETQILSRKKLTHTGKKVHGERECQLSTESC